MPIRSVISNDVREEKNSNFLLDKLFEQARSGGKYNFVVNQPSKEESLEYCV